MIRGITSLIVLLAVATVLVAGPCLACTQLVKQPAKDPCCDPGKCKKAATCISPIVDFSRVEQAIPVALPVISSWSSEVVPIRIAAAPAPAAGPHSPPDLNLLNSVLNI